MMTSRAMLLLSTALVALCAGLACADELLPAGGASIQMPEQAGPGKPTGVELLSDGGFEGVALDQAKVPAWQVVTHVFSYDAGKARELECRITAARVAEIRTSGSLEGACHAFLANPEAADQWRGGVSGPDFCTYLSRFVTIPPLAAPGRLTLSFAYKAKLSDRASNSKVRVAASFFGEGKEPWRKPAIGEFLQYHFGESAQWRREAMTLMVPQEARALRLLLYVDGCGEAAFDDVHLVLGQWPAELEMRLFPFAWLDNTFCLGENDPGLLCFALRNPRGLTLKKPVAVVELPAGFELVDARFGIASRESLPGGATLYRMPIAGLRGVLRKPKEDYEVYNMLNCLVRSSLPASARTCEARYWTEDGLERSAPRTFSLKTIKTRHAPHPKLFRAGAVVSHEMDFTTPEAMDLAARLYDSQGFSAIQIYPHTAISRLLLDRGIERYLEANWIVNGYHLGRGPKPDSARMVQPDGTFHPDGICPQEVIDRGPYFRSDIEANLRQHLVTDRTADQIMPNWEPYMYRGKGCFCDRCQRAFAAFSKLPAAEIAASWPKDVATRHAEEWARFRAYQHGRLVVALDRTAVALGKEAGIESHFIPVIAASSLTEGDYQRKHFREIDPYEYAAELPWLEPWGPYVFRSMFLPAPASPGRQLFVYCSAREVMNHVARRIASATRRPKLIAYPHGQQGQDWLTEPESLAMQVLSYFVAGWHGAMAYHFPRGYDARWWNALAEANEAIAGCESMVFGGQPDEHVRVVPLSRMPARAAFTARERQHARDTYPSALEARLLQVRAFRKEPAVLVAVGNFWESGQCVARLVLPGLEPGKQYLVSDQTARLTFAAEKSDSWSGADLSRGITIQVPALRWRFLMVQPEIAAKPQAARVRPSELAGLLQKLGQPTLDSAAKPRVDMLVDYYQQMSVPKPLVVRSGDEWQTHRTRLKREVLRCAGLAPLPDRIPLDVHQSPALDHPWCTVRRVAYQLWPGVYSTGLLYMPKQLPERPAPAMLCPHGHWQNGNAHPEVQKRCLNLARLGYVTFSSTQNHYEDLYAGVSHQTLMIWNNMRALDYLETLPEVDRSRIGVAGASGGGLQSQMIVALDPRVKAASIVGLTCDFREIMFFDHCHCLCNHFPQVMRLTDHPEISTLGLPAAVQYLTMNDWTKTFQQNNFPTIRKLYAANGAGDHVQCMYFNTGHSYDKTKREQTYGWMERWVHGRPSAAAVPEPETTTFAPQTLVDLKAPVPADKGFAEISRICRQQRGYKVPALANRAEWQSYRDRMTGILKDLLGEAVALPRKTSTPAVISTSVEGDLVVDRVDFPSEGPIAVPATVLHTQKPPAERRPVVVLCAGEGKESLLKEKGPGSPVELAQSGSLVVLADVRFVGELSAGGKDEARQRLAWERNGIIWGRPVPGMAATDLRAVLDGLVARPDCDAGRVSLVSRSSGALGIAVLFAAVLDRRIAAADVDLAGCSFAGHNLPLVSCVLQHGDVLQWAALMADRKLTIRNLPTNAGRPDWLRAAFAAAGNGQGLRWGSP